MLFNVFFIAFVVFGIFALLGCTAFDVSTERETREFLFHSGMILLLFGVLIEVLMMMLNIPIWVFNF